MQVLTANDVGIWVISLVTINLELVTQFFQTNLINIIKCFYTIYHLIHTKASIN